MILVCREKYLFSGSVDHSIKIWDMESCEVVSTIPAHENPVCTLTINGSRLYSGSLKSIKVSYLSLFVPSPLLAPSPRGSLGMKLPSSNVQTTSVCKIQVWDIETKNLVREMPTQNHWVRALVTSEKYLYSGSYQAVKVSHMHGYTYGPSLPSPHPT